MRRALRWMLLVTSVGIFLTTAVLCVRSRYVRPLNTFIKWGSPDAYWSAAFQADRIGHTLYLVSRSPTVSRTAPTTTQATTQRMKYGRVLPGVLFNWNFAGFFLVLEDIEDRGLGSEPIAQIVYLRIPYWFVFMLTALIGARCIRGIVRDRNNRKQPTACKTCGYDLRAGHDKCPECGGESHVKVGAVDSTITQTAPAGRR